MRGLPTGAALWLLAGMARGGPLTWPQAAREARDHNPALASAREAVDAAASGVTIATAGFLPSLSANGDLSRTGSRALDRSGAAVGPEADASSYEFGGSASWNLFEGGATWSARRQAVAAFARARASYRQASRQLRATLRSAFDRLLFDQRNLELLLSIKARLNKDTRYLEIQFRSGREPRWTFLKAQADEAGVDWQMTQAALDIAAQQQTLGTLLGRDADGATALVAEGDLSAPAAPADVRGQYASLETRNPDILLEAAAVDSDEAALSRARATWFPTVRASADYDRADGAAWPPTRAGWSAGLSVSLPLFSGGGDLAAITQARHTWIASRHALDDARATARSSLFAAWASYVSQTGHQPVLQLTADAAAERFRTVQGLYEAGQAGYLDFEQAESTLTQAQQSLLSGRLNLAQANESFVQALGSTLEDEDQGEQKP